MRNYFLFGISLTLAMLLSCGAVAQQLKERLEGLAGIDAIETLETTLFPEKYVFFIEQPLDHADPSRGTFRQRVIVAHAGFDRPTVIVTEGYGAAYALRPQYRDELSRLFDTNLVVVEHRYFLESTPDPLDWDYLTAENLAADLHAVTSALKSVYQGKWMATGISKGGQTTLLYRAFYPSDVDISVPYVAPVARGVEDGRHEPFIAAISTPQDRQMIEDFQMELLKRKNNLLPLFRQKATQEDWQYRLPLEEIYDYAVLEMSFAFWQWGGDPSDLPGETSSDEELFAAMLSVSSPSYFVKESPTTPFFVQAARELGYYGYDTQPFKEYLTITDSKGYLHKIFLPEELVGMEFRPELQQKISDFLETEDVKMIFIYGEYDPWTAVGITQLAGKENMYIYIQPKGSHRARIATMPQPQQQEIIDRITAWLQE